MKNDPVLFSSNYCHCEGAGYAEVSSAPILNYIYYLKVCFCGNRIHPDALAEQQSNQGKLILILSEAPF